MNTEDTEQFIGLTKRQAYDLAEKLGLMVRICRIDGRKLLGDPEDERDDRLCLEFDERKVTTATVQ